MQEDAHLFLHIRNSVDSEALGLINHCKFVKELMDYLEFPYFGKGNISSVFDVCKAFYQFEKHDRSFMAYFMDYKEAYGGCQLYKYQSKTINYRTKGIL